MRAGERWSGVLLPSGVFLLIATVIFLVSCGNGEDEDAEAVAATPTTVAPWPPPPEPTSPPAESMAQDVESLAEEAGCVLTPTSDSNAPWMTEVSPDWMSVGERQIAPADPGSGGWYTGSVAVIWHVSSWDEIDAAAVVTGRHLGSGIELQPSEAGFQWEVPDGVMSRAWVELPAEGCWQIAIGDDDFTVYVLPLNEHPEIIARQEQRESMIAYPLPDACDVTAWVGPTTGRGTPLPVGYWLDIENVDLYSVHALLYTNRSEVFIATDDQNVAIEGRSETSPGVAVHSEMNPAAGGDGPLISGVLTFPVSGCWNLSVEAGGATAEATVYVYPDACRRQPGEELSFDCIVPD